MKTRSLFFSLSLFAIVPVYAQTIKVQYEINASAVDISDTSGITLQESDYYEFSGAGIPKSKLSFWTADSKAKSAWTFLKKKEVNGTFSFVITDDEDNLKPIDVSNKFFIISDSAKMKIYSVVKFPLLKETQPTVATGPLIPVRFIPENETGWNKSVNPFFTSGLGPRYLVVYDYSSQNLQFYKNKTKDGNTEAENLELKKVIRPMVNNYLLVSVRNYNPYVDSVTFSYSYEDRNLEGRENFSSLITPAASPATTSKTTEKSTELESTDPDVKKKQTDTLKTLLSLKQQLDEFYNSRQKEPQLNADILQRNVDFIRSAITGFYQIDSVTEKNLVDVANRLVKETGISDGTSYVSAARQSAILFHAIADFHFLNFAPVQVMNHDATNISLSVKQKDGRKQKLDMQFLTSGGWKIDFSTGIFFSGLTDYSYFTKPDTKIQPVYFVDSGFQATDSVIGMDTIPVNKIYREDQGNFNIGIGAMAHVYPRTGTRVNVGLTAGILLNSNVQPEYLIGGSLMLGYEQRFILSAGEAFGRVKRLRSDYAEGDLLDQNMTTPITSDVWKNNWFVSITYNLGGTAIGGGK